MKILSIDQSTSATTAFLFSQDAEPQKIFAQLHRQHVPRAGWVEHDPREILGNIKSAIGLGKAAGATVLGLANQGESCLAWDSKTKEPLTPIIVWQDARTAQVCSDLAAAGHGALIQSRSGLRLSPYFSAAKLAWCFQNVENAAMLLGQGRLRLGTTDAYFRDVLTGRCETDAATASRTSLMNLSSCLWDDDLCAMFGVPRAALPEIGACNGDLGEIDGLRLASSIVDQQAALYGHQLRHKGGTKITFGTGAFALSLLGPTLPVLAGKTVPTVAWRRQGEETQYAIEGGVFTASSALNWAKEARLIANFPEIENFASPSMIERDLVFVPALSGLGCPHWNEAAKAAWLGLDLTTARTDLVQAVCEGVALRMAEIIEEIESISAISEPVGIDGGMTKSPGFCQFLADVIQKPLLRSDFGERTSLGVALLAADALEDGLGCSLRPNLGRNLRRNLRWNETTHDIRPERDLSCFRARFGEACALVDGWSCRSF